MLILLILGNGLLKLIFILGLVFYVICGFNVEILSLIIWLNIVLLLEYSLCYLLIDLVKLLVNGFFLIYLNVILLGWIMLYLVLFLIVML